MFPLIRKGSRISENKDVMTAYMIEIKKKRGRWRLFFWSQNHGSEPKIFDTRKVRALVDGVYLGTGNHGIIGKEDSDDRYLLTESIEGRTRVITITMI